MGLEDIWAMAHVYNIKLISLKRDQ